MFKVTVQLDTSRLTSSLNQIPFASALALTRTAQAAQAEIRSELPQRFTIRNNWVAQGIRIEKATKQNLEATVLSRDKFMVLQETGGTKTPRGHSLAIPMDVTAKQGIVPRANWPRALLGKPGVFRARIGGLDGLWQRLKRRSKKQKAGGRTLKLLYLFEPSVQVTPRFGFLETVRRVARATIADNFRAAWDQAVRTAR